MLVRKKIQIEKKITSVREMNFGKDPIKVKDIAAKQGIRQSTVKAIYSRHPIQRKPCNSGHFFVEPVKSRSNSLGKTPI